MIILFKQTYHYITLETQLHLATERSAQKPRQFGCHGNNRWWRHWWSDVRASEHDVGRNCYVAHQTHDVTKIQGSSPASQSVQVCKNFL